MLQTAGIHHHAKTYISVLSAFSVDSIQLRSLASTAYKLRKLEALVNSDAKRVDILRFAYTIDAYWYEQLLVSPLFSKYQHRFQWMRRLINSHRLQLRNENHERVVEDATVTHVLVANPTSEGPELMDLSDGEAEPANRYYTSHAATLKSDVVIRGEQCKVWNFIESDVNYV